MKYKIYLKNFPRNFLIKYRSQIGMVVLLNFFISIILYFVVDKEYVSSASILPNSSSDSNPVANIASQFGYDVGNQTNQLTDPLVLKKIATNYDISSKTLKEKISIDGETKEIFFFLFPDYDINNKLDFENGILKLGQNHLYISKDLEGPIINFKVITNHPQLSFEICSIIFKNTIQYVNRLDQSTKKEKLTYLTNRIQSVKKELNEKEDVIEDFLIQNRDINSPSLQTEYNRLISELGVINQLYISLRTEQEFKRVDLNSDNNNNIYLIDEPNIPVGRSYPKSSNLVSFFIQLNLLCLGIYCLMKVRIKEIVD
tara:strand:- start:7389 stop:8330 length:942 start_codon:yes stop_codon:yes gene_type:complete